MSKKKSLVLLVATACCVSGLCFAGMELASMLSISAAAAKKVINIIDTLSIIWMILSLVAVIIGAGGISAALVATAKKLIKKFGKKYATMW